MKNSSIHNLLPVMRQYACNGFYIQPEIPPHKLKNVCDQYGIAPDTVLAVLDATVFGSATDGFVVASDGIYEHRMGVPFSFAPWEEICNFPSISAPPMTFNDIAYGNGKIMSIAGSGISRDIILRMLIECVSSVVELTAETQTYVTQSTPVAANSINGAATKICSKYSGSYYILPAFTASFNKEAIYQRLRIPRDEDIYALVSECGPILSAPFQGIALTKTGVFSFVGQTHFFVPWYEVARSELFAIGQGATQCGEHVITLSHGPSQFDLISLLEELATLFTASDQSMHKKPEVSDKPSFSLSAQNKSSQGTDMIDIREASEETIATLPGIGIVKAKKIVKLRKDRKFKSIEDLGKLLSLSEPVMRNLKNVLTGFENHDEVLASPSSKSLLDINKANVDELLLLPGITADKAELLVRTRERKIGFVSFEEIRSLLDLPPHVFIKLCKSATVEKYFPKGQVTSASGRIIDF